MVRARGLEQFLPETDVLRPVDKTVNSDDWPTFSLADAVVYHPDGVTMANALLVNEEGPFIVRGRLEIDDDEDAQYLVRSDIRTASIQIDRSLSYAIGYDELPSAVVWLSGEAGWFQISPHPTYARIYRDMCDVSLLYHMLIEIYKDAAEKVPRSERKQINQTLDIRTILFEYAVAIGDGITYDEAVDKCVRLGPSLLAHFSTVTEVRWKETSFCKWLVREIRDRDRTDRRSSRGVSVSEGSSQSFSGAGPALSQPLPIRASPRTTVDTLSQTIVRESPVPLPLTASFTTRIGDSRRPTTGSPTTTSSVGVGVHAAGGGATGAIGNAAEQTPRELKQSVFRTFLEAVQEIGRDIGNPSKISQSKVHVKLFNHHRMKDYQYTKVMSAYFSKELQQALGDTWQASGYVAWLRGPEAQELASAPDLSLEDMPGQLLRRAPHAYPRSRPLPPSSRQLSPASSTASSSLSAQQPGGRQQPQRAAGKAPPPTPDSGGRTSGKRAGLRLPAVPWKRRLEDTDDDTDGSAGRSAGATPVGGSAGAAASSPRRPVGRPRKLTKSVVADEDSEAMALDLDSGSRRTQANPVILGDDDDDTVNEVDSDNDDDDGDDVNVESEQDEIDRQLDETVLVVHSEQLVVSTRPTGPNRTWKCPEPGCSFFVRDAEPLSDSEDADEDEDEEEETEEIRIAREAQARIRDHLRSHEQEMLNRVDLAIAEGSRGHVSVNHLLAKIRGLAEKNQRQQPSASAQAAPKLINGIAMPSPIVRQFLV